MRLHEVEGLLVRRAMEHYQGNISRAARALGLSRAALYRRLERHGINN
jgi:transcriptional regulator of acetoin/glycerol metabolism